MTVGDLRKALKGIDPKKEIVVLTNSAFSVDFVRECMEDDVVLVHCKPPPSKQALASAIPGVPK